MNRIKIFIDHYAADEDLEFAKRLKSRIKNVEYDFDIQIYSDLSLDDGESQDEDYWEKPTAASIRDATIVIPIISESYISFVSKRIEKEFNSIIDSKDRFLFPVLFKPANWGGFKWVVRSKLTPSDEQPIYERSTSEIDSSINSVVLMIKNIMTELSESDEHKKIEVPSIKELERSVFISHDHDDADFAELLKLKLEKQGLEGWIDSERLKIGQDWREEIDAGIENSLAVIAIMTPEARKSEYVTYEWAFAWGKGKKIFPIMLKQTQLHPRLESLQYLDFTNRSSRPWDELIESIQAVLNA